jgi:hypothetical protein
MHVIDEGCIGTACADVVSMRRYTVRCYGCVIGPYRTRSIYSGSNIRYIHTPDYIIGNGYISNSGLSVP